MIDRVQRNLSLLMLSFGMFVLLFSLLGANKSSAGETSRLLARRIYVGRTILPDHILYPFLMVGDKIKLSAAPPEKKILLQVEYADRRFWYASELLKRDDAVLALATLSKSQKYLFEATGEILKDPQATDSSTKDTVRKALENSLVQLEVFRTEFTGDDNGIIGDLAQETRILLLQLNQSTPQN